jgi:hypothetical protein
VLGWLEWQWVPAGEVSHVTDAVRETKLTIVLMNRYYDKQGFVRLGDVVDEPDHWPATVLERRVERRNT